MGKILKNGTEYGLGGNELIDRIYPVGSIYISTSSTFNPQNVWGGTWRKTADGRCLIGANDTYPLGSTGGSTTHKHSTNYHSVTANEMPSHNHYSTNGWSGYASNRVGGGVFLTLGKDKSDRGGIYKDTASGLNSTLSSTGGSGAHSHGDTGTASTMQPYLAVYIWERTA